MAEHKIYRGEPPPPPPPRARRPDATQAVQQAMSHRPAPTPEQLQARSQDAICMWTLEAVQASLVRRAKPQVCVTSFQISPVLLFFFFSFFFW